MSTLLLIGVITAALVVGVFHVVDTSKDDSQQVEEELKKGVVVINCEDIELSLDDAYRTLDYTIEKLNCEIVDIKISTNNDNISIVDKNIYPKKEGISIITIKVTTNKSSVFTKDVNVKINKSDFTANLKIININNNNVDKLFVGNKYYLIVTLNKQLNYEHNILTSENISNFKLLENKNNTLKYEFDVNSFLNNSEFIFKYKDLNTSLKIKTYNYIDDFKLKINNNYVNKIDLYLFNKDFILQANNNNYYDNYNFSVETTQNSLNNYEISVDNNDVVKILNNNICALKEGNCNLIILAKDGSNFKREIPVNVQICKIESLNFDLEKLTYFENEVISLKAKVDKLFAVYNLEFYYNNKKIENSISFKTKGEYNLLVKDTVSNLTNIVVVLIKEDSSLSKMSIKINDSFLNNNNASFKDDVLTIKNTNLSIDIPLSIAVSNYQNNLNCLVTFSNKNVGGTYGQIQNAIILTLTKQEETFVTISLKDNNEISYTFKIVFN